MFSFICINSDDDDDSRENSRNVQTSYINNAFNNRRSFTCPLVKSLLATGTSGADLSPEDIDIVASMGDSLSTGVGLWPGTDIEFRGAAFTIGGDATIDGLVTFANILAVFNPKLEGISHGMGSASSLPAYQFNVAETGAETDHMNMQANELIARIKALYTPQQLSEKWIMIFITIGTEELCKKCDEPNMNMLRRALITLRRSLPKVFVVLIGPVHVAKSSHLTYNLLKPRCKCLSQLTNDELRRIQKTWRDSLRQLEKEFVERHYQTFVILVLPMLSIESRYPEQLFVPERALLNRRGHTYAAKWLWNRLISGPRYNVSRMPLSEESYYCPSLGCPFFRTPSNLQHCVVITKSEYNRIHSTKSPDLEKTEQAILGNVNIREHFFLWVFMLILLSTCSVLSLGTVFFCHGMRQTKGRFEQIQGV
ncbi:phospholipase B1, membrane-associated [Ditylenchus destructor]|uniref:Phospholipase B1, membrane-associated n=1 Tax=Ditylenchus destructor TaxID=166010 RepID=A0AAD4RA21_9BILA|nr:phospholipase B1, membrane-associated [Ditylenchus destructor]